MQKLYREACEIDSDIHMHLPKLKEYASKCDHITEFGFRHGHSTIALLMGKPKKLVTYDINPDCRNTYKAFLTFVTETNFKFMLGNTLHVEIEETDFLFIDSLHTYAQLSGELKKHGHKVRKYIGFHDTESFGIRDESPIRNWGNENVGLIKAIEEFKELDLSWKVDYETSFNNGLLILKKY